MPVTEGEQGQLMAFSRQRRSLSMARAMGNCGEGERAAISLPRGWLERGTSQSFLGGGRRAASRLTSTEVV